MRILPRYMILSFIGPFLMTFFIAVFVLFMQFLWKYVDDLIGKGLDFSTMAELFFYAALTTFPLALPLSILLSSLMTFGSLGEKYELVALKAAGISLQKSMLPLIVTTFLVSIGAFIFSNNILPYVNLKMTSLLYDIQQKKPALNIKEGVFYNGIDGYTIRIEKKERDGIMCRNIMIYDHTKPTGNTIVVTADSGRLTVTADKQFLTIVLFSGTRFEETEDDQNKTKYPLIRSRFKEETINLDLSGFRMNRTDEELFKSNYAILNIKQINQTIDSLRLQRDTASRLFNTSFEDLLFANTKASSNDSNLQKSVSAASGISNPHHQINIGRNTPQSVRENDPSFKLQQIDAAINLARAKKFTIDNWLSELDMYNRPILLLSVEWHKKFALSFACFILFFIGAPLGAIIRKGGLGMPVVVSVFIFIFFWIITISCEKMVKEGVLIPLIGMWISTIITLPIGIFLTSKATSDSAIMDTDSYIRFFQKLLWWKK